MATKRPQPCSFESISECHQKKFTVSEEITKLTSEDDETIQLLRLRTKIAKKNIETLCAHHERELVTQFSKMKKKCCDPHSRHPGTSRTKPLKIVRLNRYRSLQNPPENLVPGDKLCPDCNIQLERLSQHQNPLEPESVSEEEHTQDDFSKPMILSSPEKEQDSCLMEVNETLVSLQQTPVKLHSKASWTRKSSAKKKLATATQTLKSKLEQSLDISLSESEDDSENRELLLYRKVMTELKSEFDDSKSYRERVQILTVSPFTIQETMKQFGATNHMVKKSRQVKKEKGILGLCNKNKGKPMSENLKREVVEFYENDEYSRMCPGAKDFVTVRDKNGTKEKHQKRLVLCNLDELHAAWKEKNPNKKISFSAFAALRPKWCVIAGASGTHYVCVCKYHQNPKLMAEVCLKSSVHDLMRYCVCSTENEKCMMGQCKDCPGKQGLVDYLNNCEELQDVDEATYQKWISTDRTKLLTITESKDDFIDNFSSQVMTLTRHSFTAKSQSDNMKSLKTTMNPLEDVIIQGDFAENYTYVVQDEIQSWHWENTQATMHPFVAYRRNAEGELEHKNVCVMSDYKEHNSTTVHSFLQAVIPELKIEWPEMKRIKYFTDGCGGQYKNRYNFINLCYHFDDFGIEAEWHFFATSHGKSACDGIGGTVKRLLKKASLQRPYSDAIITCEAAMDFCIQNIPGIKFINVKPETVESYDDKLKSRYDTTKTINGTLKFHRFVPKSRTTLDVYFTSNQNEKTTTVSVVKGSTVSETVDDSEDFEINLSNFVCVLYDDKPWIGIVEDISEEFGDFHIKFMHPNGPANFFNWPENDDKCWREHSDILCVIEAPSISAHRGRIRYKLSQTGTRKIAEVCEQWPIS